MFFISLSSSSFHAVEVLTGSSILFAGSTTTYFYDDQNSYCSNLEWKIYEIGVRKTTGISGSSNYMNVICSSTAASGFVEASR